MYELNGKLQQAEWKKNSKTEEEENKKLLYRKIYEETFEKEKNLLEEEMDGHFKAQFEEN